jgi:hypothetical protein
VPLHSVSLITTISAAFGLALILGFVAVRLKLPALVGYLIAGILLGPATPGFVANVELSRQLADIGVMLLMFGVGLHFSFDDLLAVRRIALPGAIAQMAVATALGMVITSFWGWSFGAGIVFGLALSVASTVVVLRTLEDRGVLDSINGRITVGWLVVEDLVMVLVLVLLPSLSAWLGGNASGLTEGTPNRELLKTLGFTLGEVAVFVLLMLVVGRRLFPWILWQVARTGSRELFTLCVVAAAVGIAYGSAELFLRILRARGLFRRDGHERIRSELSGSRRVLTAQGCFCGSVLRIGWNAVRPGGLPPDTFGARKMIEIARTLKPDVETIVRTHSDVEAALLRNEKAGKVFIGEHELAIGMTRHVLERIASGADERQEVSAVEERIR